MAEYADAEGLALAESVAYADSASDLPMLEAVGHPVAVNPEAKLAAIARKRGWHVEHWSKAPGGPRPCCPWGRSPPGGPPVKALVFERSLPRTRRPGGGVARGRGSGGVGRALALTEVDDPRSPGPGWQRVRPRLAGICGSDLATVDGASRRATSSRS